MLTEALVAQHPGAEFIYRSIHIDTNLRANEVLIQMRATGVCHTDLNFRDEDSIPGLHPAVFGHEGAGVVLEVGSSVTRTLPGDHVVLTYSCCGSCKYCKRKETSFCYDWERDNFGVGRGVDGSKAFFAEEEDGAGAITSHFFGQSSFAKLAVVVETCCVKIAREDFGEVLAPLGCGIQTGAGAMLNVVKPSEDSTVLVVGAGAVGLAALMALKLLPSPPGMVIAVDVVPERLEMARKYGATHVVNSKENADLKSALRELTAGKGVDGAIDTTGRPEILRTLLESSANKGTVVSVGVGKLTAEVSTVIFDTVNSGRSYVGCCMGNCYPQEFIPKLIAAWKEGKFPFTDLIKTYSAQDMNTAAKDVLKGEVVKAVLLWE
ncbi:Benzyl alcohol dehydrogenase [Hyphodiscus hymeniophilus]|uniref:Benzyl alcohol dehydrogenase n=1 Tax=Hyphodiscus hymeniophilus TaxID=353542 RepID=A0A9P6SLM4_9HELO|nr:Benzyl alcohol dehydrogenase [Hyphodiscus hymeniophilus]